MTQLKTFALVFFGVFLGSCILLGTIFGIMHLTLLAMEAWGFFAIIPAISFFVALVLAVAFTNAKWGP